MQTMFSPFRSSSWSVTPNRCATSDVATTSTQASLLKGNLKHDRADISPRFAGKELTYLEYGETHQGKRVYYQYEDGISNGKKGVFIKDADQKPLFVQIKDGADTESMPPPATPKK
jgi:hypothetical protein